MNLTRGSVLNMTTDRGTAHFTGPDGKPFTLPLVGWATTVTWAIDDPGCQDYENSDHTHETDVVPVVLTDDGHPMTLRSFLAEDLENRIHLVRIELA